MRPVGIDEARRHQAQVRNRLEERRTTIEEGTLRLSIRIQEDDQSSSGLSKQPVVAI